MTVFPDGSKERLHGHNYTVEVAVEVDRVDLGDPGYEDLHEQQADRVICGRVTLRGPRHELPGAQVTDQWPAQPTLGPQHRVDDRIEHGAERNVLLADTAGRRGDSVFLDDEQLAEHLLLAGEVHVERAPRHADAIGDRRDLGSGEALALEFRHRLVEQPGAGVLALSRAPPGALVRAI